MSNIEKIKAEIERLYDGEAPKHDQQCDFNDGYFTGIDAVSKFIDSLPEENNPEPYNPVYDEDYLNEKIAKATKSWEGVDVDKMLADCRGYEEKPSENLEEAAEEYADKHGFRVPYDGSNNYYDDVDVKASKEGFLAGAEWQKEQMMKEAVESEVVITSGGILLRDLRIEDFDYEDKVKIIIVKK